MAKKPKDDGAGQAPDFNALLDTDGTEFKAPVALPAGSYLLNIDSREFITSQKKGTPGVRIVFGVLSAEEDVDPDLLVDGNGGPLDLSKKTVREDFWLTPDSAYRLSDADTGLASKAGINVHNKTLRQIIEELPNNQVIGYVTQTPSNREGDDRMFNNLTSFREA
jgi:hypothetical protein